MIEAIGPDTVKSVERLLRGPGLVLLPNGRSTRNAHPCVQWLVLAHQYDQVKRRPFTWFLSQAPGYWLIQAMHVFTREEFRVDADVLACVAALMNAAFLDDRDGPLPDDPRTHVILVQSTILRDSFVAELGLEMMARAGRCCRVAEEGTDCWLRYVRSDGSTVEVDDEDEAATQEWQRDVIAKTEEAGHVS